MADSEETGAEPDWAAINRDRAVLGDGTTVSSREAYVYIKKQMELAVERDPSLGTVLAWGPEEAAGFYGFENPVIHIRPDGTSEVLDGWPEHLRDEEEQGG